MRSGQLDIGFLIVNQQLNHFDDAPLSEHAHANAIDLEGFVLDGGARISVAHDWDTATQAGAFVARAHDSACWYFHLVLGPDYTPCIARIFTSV